MDEIRGVCRQLQCHLKKIPDCADAPYESEANALVDRWLDVGGFLTSVIEYGTHLLCFMCSPAESGEFALVHFNGRLVITALWFQVSEKTDTHMDNLRVALELWDKLLLIGSEVDNWMGSKLAMFAESQPFQNEQDVITMQVTHCMPLWLGVWHDYSA